MIHTNWFTGQQRPICSSSSFVLLFLFCSTEQASKQYSFNLFAQTANLWTVKINGDAQRSAGPQHIHTTTTIGMLLRIVMLNEWIYFSDDQNCSVELLNIFQSNPLSTDHVIHGSKRHSNVIIWAQFKNVNCIIVCIIQTNTSWMSDNVGVGRSRIDHRINIISRSLL